MRRPLIRGTLNDLAPMLQLVANIAHCHVACCIRKIVEDPRGSFRSLLDTARHLRSL